jgi:hypothetical protein
VTNRRIHPIGVMIGGRQGAMVTISKPDPTAVRPRGRHDGDGHPKMAQMLHPNRARSRGHRQHADSARQAASGVPAGPVPLHVPAATAGSGATIRWRLFAGTILLLLGLTNVLDGLVAIINADVFEQNLAGSPTLAIINRIEAWGWLLLIIGLAMAVTSVSVLAGVMSARLVGIVIAGIDLVLQFAYLAHFPPWSMMMIFLAVLVIFALAASSDA